MSADLHPESSPQIFITSVLFIIHSSDTQRSLYCVSFGKWLISCPWKIQACCYLFFFYIKKPKHLGLFFLWFCSVKSPLFGVINALTGGMLPLIMQRAGLWVQVPCAACTSAYVKVLLCRPRKVLPVWTGAVEQPWLWQFQAEDSINSLPLSRSISSFLVSEGFLLQKKQGKVMRLNPALHISCCRGL